MKTPPTFEDFTVVAEGLEQDAREARKNRNKQQEAAFYQAAAGYRIAGELVGIFNRLDRLPEPEE